MKRLLIQIEKRVIGKSLFVVWAAYFVDGRDIGRFTMKAVDDIRTLNKSVHFRPPNNCYSINDLSSLWEKKIGRTIPRVTISEDLLLAVAAGYSLPQLL